MIMMTGRSKINLINSLSSTALIVVINLVLVPKYGILGAAISLGVDIVVMNLVKLIEVYVILKVHPFKISFLKPLMAGGISLYILFFASKFLRNIPQPLLEIALGSVILMGTYFLLLFLMRLAEEDKVILRKIKEKAMIFKRN
jgi:O-antigen/teichoic acid export membrane protein